MTPQFEVGDLFRVKDGCATCIGQITEVLLDRFVYVQFGTCAKDQDRINLIYPNGGPWTVADFQYDQVELLDDFVWWVRKIRAERQSAQ